MTEIFRLEFAGKATGFDSREFESKNSIDDSESREIERKVVQELNRFHADSICFEIEQDLGRSMPPGVRVSTDITFREGSVEWVGVVTVLDWMARLGSSISFLDYLSRAVEAAVNRSVGRHMRNATPYPSSRRMTTEVVVVPSLEPRSRYPQGRPQLSVHTPSGRRIENLLYLNTVILFVIVGLELWSRLT